MNLIFRLLRMWIAARFGAPCGPLDETRLSFRCLPTDLDGNWHMTNSRYHSFLDLGRVNYLIRRGIWGRLRAQGFDPVVGSSSIRFQKSVLPFERFTVVTRLAAWERGWLYVEQQIRMGDAIAAVALLKITFTRKTGRLSMDEIMRIVGYDGPSPPLAARHLAKDAEDRALAA